MTEYICEHVTKRAKTISDFLQANAQYFWDKSELAPDWLDLVIKSVKISFLVDDADPTIGRRRSVQLNV